MKTKFTSIAIICGTLLWSSCSTLTPAQNQALIVDLSAINSLVQNYAADGQINYAQVIPIAIDSLAIYSPNASVTTASLVPLIENAVTTFTNGTATTTGQKIAAVITSTLPAVITGLQANAILAQAATQASAGAQTVAAVTGS